MVAFAFVLYGHEVAVVYYVILFILWWLHGTWHCFALFCRFLPFGGFMFFRSTHNNALACMMTALICFRSVHVFCYVILCAIFYVFNICKAP